jgi:hypothetical protein
MGLNKKTRLKIKRVSYRVYRSINARLNDIVYDGYVNGFFSLMVQIYVLFTISKELLIP